MISCFKGKFKVTSPRAYRVLGGKREFHGGLDLVALEDANVYAIADGIVDAVPYEANGFGYYVRQKLSDGRRIYYGHMAKGSICVKAGDKIKRGDKLGVMGSTGYSTGKHTHIELRPVGTAKTSLDICAFTGIPNKVGTYLCSSECSADNAAIKVLESGNDIIWELMNGKLKVEISEVQRAVKALDDAKKDTKYCSLYWILHKIVNGN